MGFIWQRRDIVILCVCMKSLFLNEKINAIFNEAHRIDQN